MGKHHVLKIWPEFYKAVKSGRLTHQVRSDDRGFTDGDTVVMHEFDPVSKEYLGTEPLFFEVGTVIYISAPGILTNASFSILPIKTVEVTAKTETRNLAEIAGELLFKATGGGIKDRGVFRVWANWKECDSKALFQDAAQKLIMDISRASLAQLDGKGGAA